MAPGMTITESHGFQVWCDSPECADRTWFELTIEEARDRVEAHRSLHDLLGIMDRAAKR